MSAARSCFGATASEPVEFACAVSNRRCHRPRSGIVGVSAALALQARGRTVAIVDRLGEAAGETSFGNTGIVQSEAVLPYLFPRDLGRDRARRAQPRSARPYPLQRAALDRAGACGATFNASTAAGASETARAMAALVGAANAEHRKLAEAANAGATVARDRLDKGLAQRPRRGCGA